MTVRLEPLTDANREAIARVRVAEEQRAFLDTQSFADFLAWAPLHPTFEVFALVDGAAVIGFVSYGHQPDDPSRWWIPLIVIDEAYQHRGHGRAALRAVIADVLARASAAVALGLAYQPANLVAERLYTELGFERAGIDEKGEVVAWPRLRR
jgi:diamine N-acetyltransferase